MGNFSINFSSGAGLKQPHVQDDPLYSLLKGENGVKNNNSALFGKKANSQNRTTVPAFLKTRIESKNDLQTKNTKLWDFLHPGQKTDENNAVASADDPYGMKALAEAEQKRLKYNYKSVSKKIVQSKDSDSAEKAVSAAKQATRDLKRQAVTGKCDAEEIEAALLHSKRMELIAEKHLKFIKEEETAERFQKEGNITGALSATAMLEDSDTVRLAEQKADEDLKTEIRSYLESLGYEFDKEDVSDLTEELTDDFSEEMSDLTDMLDSPDLYGMEPEDVKMLKLKHRAKENKDLAKADAEYLKAVFEKLNESMHTDAAAQAAASSGGAVSASANSDPLGLIGAPGSNINVIV